MSRPRLSVLWALSILGAALVPLGLAGWATLGVLERSIGERARAAQDQVALAGQVVLADHIEAGKRKLSALARLLQDADDPKEQARRLDRLLDPPDIFLEVSCWTGDAEPRARMQNQLPDYNLSQLSNNSRAFDPVLAQPVLRLAHDDPVIAVPRTGKTFVSETVDRTGGIEGLPVSVPGPGGSVLVGMLDLAGLRRIFARIASGEERVLMVLDAHGGVVLASRADVDVPDPIECQRSMENSSWKLVVREPRTVAFAPLAEARRGVLVGFGVACALCLILAISFAGLVLRPVRELALFANRLGSGDLSARSGIERGDEIGQLASAFDRMAAELEQLDRMKSEFVAHVSHELRTPLTSARLTLANVEEGLVGREALSRVRADLDRLVQLVNELLDLARVEAGIRLDKQAADLGAIVAAAVDTVRPLARVTLAVAGRGETLPVDRARVHQIVVNLVDNALKHASSRVDVLVDGREVRVADDGPGVPAELRERIFEGFVRLESQASTQGFGLGLTIARKLANLHGATLHCDGNAFVLRF